jgi:hypothetical protein
LESIRRPSVISRVLFDVRHWGSTTQAFDDAF